MLWKSLFWTSFIWILPLSLSVSMSLCLFSPIFGDDHIQSNDGAYSLCAIYVQFSSWNKYNLIPSRSHYVAPLYKWNYTQKSIIFGKLHPSRWIWVTGAHNILQNACHAHTHTHKICNFTNFTGFCKRKHRRKKCRDMQYLTQFLYWCKKTSSTGGAQILIAFITFSFWPFFLYCISIETLHFIRLENVKCEGSLAIVNPHHFHWIWF